MLRRKTTFFFHRLFRKAQIAQHSLNYLFWECTLRCNLNCLHCGSDCHKGSLTPDMPLADFLKVVDALPQICEPNNTLIVLTGGEPCLRTDLEQIGLALYHRGFPWGMVSNGLALTPKRLKSLQQSGLRSLTISLDGLEPEHNHLRQHAQSFKNAVEAIYCAAQINDIEFDVVTCVHSGNLHQLASIKELLIAKGVKKWRLFSIFPKGRAVENNLVFTSSNQLHSLMQFIADTRNEGRILASFGCEGFLGPYELKVRNTPFFCRAGISVAGILADGSITACPSMRSVFVQGNIYTHAFNQVWNNGYQVMRNRSWAKTGPCRTCKMWKNCEGNGLHLRHPNDEGPDICHYNVLRVKS